MTQRGLNPPRRRSGVRSSSRARARSAGAGSRRNAAGAGVRGGRDPGPRPGHGAVGDGLPDGGVGGPGLHRAQAVAGGVEAGHARRAVEPGRPDSLRLVHPHAGGAAAHHRHVAVLQPHGQRRPPGVRLELELQEQRAGPRDLRALSVDDGPEPRPAVVAGPAETAEGHHPGAVGRAGVRVRELLAADGGAGAVGHGVTVGRQAGDRPAQRLEAAGAGGQHHRSGAEDGHFFPVHREADGAGHGAVLLQQSGDHGPVVDDGAAPFHLAAKHQRRCARPHGDGPAGAQRDALAEHAAGRVPLELHAPGHEVLEARMGFAEAHLGPVAPVQAVSVHGDLLHPRVQIVAPRLVEHQHRPSERRLTRRAQAAFVDDDDGGAGGSGLERREAPGHAAADHEDVAHDDPLRPHSLRAAAHALTSWGTARRRERTDARPQIVGSGKGEPRRQPGARLLSVTPGH